MPNKSNLMSFDKSFQSQNQNKSKYQISNLFVSHENNIICMGKIKQDNNEKDKNNFNGYGEIKKVIDYSNSNINSDELKNISNNRNKLNNNNYENCTNNINNYNQKKNINNTNYLNKNDYNNNLIVTIKKRNLAEKLKEEIQKSFNKNTFYSPSLLTNRKINIDNNINNKINIIENYNHNNNNNSVIYNGNILKSNGKKIKEKVMRCSSMLNKKNLFENNPISKNQNTFVNNYNENIPIRHYDLNRSQYVTQYININDTNTNINKNINISSSISSIINQTIFDNWENNNLKSRDSDGFFLNSFEREYKVDENEKQNMKNTIQNKKKSSNIVVIYENGIRNNSVNKIINVQKTKSKIKSNGKVNEENYNHNNDLNNNTTINKNNKKNNLLLKTFMYKCLNGNSKNSDLNNNIIILSKHKKNDDNNNDTFRENLITCSVTDLNCHQKNKNKNIFYKNENQILSDFNLHKNNNKKKNNN